AERLEFFQLAQAMLQLTAVAAKFGFAQFALDGGQQACRISLDDVVLSAGAHSANCDLLTDRAGEENEGNVQALLPDHLQSLRAFKAGKQKTGNDDAPFLSFQDRGQRRGVAPALMRSVVTAATEHAEQEVAVVLRIFNDECTQGSSHDNDPFAKHARYLKE